MGPPTQKRQEWSSSCSQIMTSTCSSRGGCAEASQWSQSAMPKPTILWSVATTQKSLAATSSTWTRITSMVGPWASPYPRAPSVGRRLLAAGQNHRRSSRGLYTRGRPGVPRQSTQRAQCISAGTGAHGGLEKMNVRVSAQPPWRWGGADRGWEAGPKTSVTRPAMCFTIGICSYTRLWACVWPVHRALRFDQSPWMDPYIRMNTELRRKAASDFEKDL